VNTPLFTTTGDVWVATESSRGPWDPGAAHGGPVAALLVHLADSVPSAAPMQPVRVTTRLLRPYPIGVPLTASVAVPRDGRRVRVVEVTMHAEDGTPVARAESQWIRTTELDLPADHERWEASRSALPPRSSGRRERASLSTAGVVSFPTVCEFITVAGSWGERGPYTGWVRIPVPLADGIELSPAARAAAIADYGNGIARSFEMGEWIFINPDVTLHLHRLPAGEWIGTDAQMIAEPTGIGVSHARLYDETGPVGWANQSIMVDRGAP
jgi:hypothetical protein